MMNVTGAENICLLETEIKTVADEKKNLEEEEKVR